MGQYIEKIRKLQDMGISNSFKFCRDHIIAIFIRKFMIKKWASKTKEYLGTSKEKRDIPLILSLTTYPKRIQTVHLVIRTLLCQTLKPDAIILWLAKEQFPNKENDLPKELIELRQNGLTIEWCSDIKSYKKLIPTIKKYPNSFIITFDDDLYYLPSTVERLYNEAIKNPKMIHCHRGTKITMEKGDFKAIPGSYLTYKIPTYLHKLTGCGGVCYPPNVLYKDLIKEDLFMKLAPTNDDIWFWLMGVLNGTKCNIIKNNLPGLFEVQNSQEESLHSINDKGSRLFWKDFYSVLDYYPELRRILIREYNEVRIGNEKN